MLMSLVCVCVFAELGGGVEEDCGHGLTGVQQQRPAV